MMWAERIETKETLAKFQAERGKEKLREARRRQTTRGPMISHQKPHASENQKQALWSFAQRLG